MSLCQEIESVLRINSKIESILGIINKDNCKERVLAAGTVLIKGLNNSYSIKFLACFKFNNYQVSEKFITQNKKPDDDVIIKWTHKFLIFVKNLENYMFIDIDPLLQIVWILIEVLAKVGYFSTNTQKIKILSSGITLFVLELNTSNYKLKYSENLPQNLVIITSFKCLPSNYEPSFKIHHLDKDNNEKIHHLNKDNNEKIHYLDKNNNKKIHRLDKDNNESEYVDPFYRNIENDHEFYNFSQPLSQVSVI
ncbi:3691_t:CDS:2 [Dentiscutata erythropus]|uniref:3691_t:CDS:1 n=1 Tax=Dentiscutata erythropus TaxID=1348616 RepID=A0A9N9ES16_9GLOM|nr:3691_t:CDS:2 [Dentiscutata erythropus]